MPSPADDLPPLPRYRPLHGPFPVATVMRLVVHDQARRRDIELRIRYPEAPGRFPLVVFSHGAWGSNAGYRPLVRTWAEHGYVVVQPNHLDSHVYGVRVGDPSVFRHWRSRAEDLRFVLRAIQADRAALEPWGQRIDPARIGVGGHSFGATTAQLVAGVRPTVDGEEVDYGEPSVRAVIVLSGQGRGDGLEERSWRGLDRPALVMTGSLDHSLRNNLGPEWRAEPFTFAPPGDKYLVFVEGLDHGYGGLTGAAWPGWRPNPRHVAVAQRATLSFWDAYLKDAPLGNQYLASDLSDGEIHVSTK